MGVLDGARAAAGGAGEELVLAKRRQGGVSERAVGGGRGGAHVQVVSPFVGQKIVGVY